MSACGTGWIATTAPVSSLPDLTVSAVSLGMQGVPVGSAQCVPTYGPYVIQARIQNLGGTATYNIPVIELSTGTNLMIGELGPAQSMDVYFPTAAAGGTYSVVVDPQNTIPESNEENNISTYLAITPTPPAVCPTATAVPDSGYAGTQLTLAVLKNSTYRSPDWGEFQLTDGVYYRTPPNSLPLSESYTSRFLGPIIYGDINADGVEDAVVILVTQNGGSGHFVELAVMLNQEGNAYNTATTSLGDRVVVESGELENGIIKLSLRVHGPNDGLCCPSQLVTWSFVLDGNLLIKLP